MKVLQFFINFLYHLDKSLFKVLNTLISVLQFVDKYFPVGHEVLVSFRQVATDFQWINQSVFKYSPNRSMDV